ncbi:DUF2239 family protein [Gimibacter soli]|uniref:DUF2239 family protein n=1 Tax=Gimibacter soli TaxID=3024400 RepID=A0AAE9XQS6_9PROT|nr:DUF2239 family protein [Gimibacter soli]WCL55482.1 DUF2239 family protein [Gimibacter soli]
MTADKKTTYTAFAGEERIGGGDLAKVALLVREVVNSGDSRLIQIFDDATGRVTDIDTRGTETETIARLGVEALEEKPARGRGRPKLGVVPGEVTLLPRHWDWLKSQPGGASVTLRKLIEAARHDPKAAKREAQTAAYRVMSAMAGDRPGFEEASRAFFAGDKATFDALTKDWPADIRAYIAKLAKPAF